MGHRTSEEIQGNILAPFNKPHQMFLFLNFRNDQEGARRWLAAITGGDRIATTRAVAEHNDEFKAKRAEAGADQPRQTWMGVGLTSGGLVTLHPELAADLVVYEAFWRGPLVGGPDEDGNWTASAALVGGEEQSDPRGWVVGGPGQEPVDALVTIAADHREDLRERVEAERRQAEQAGLAVLELRLPDGGSAPGQRGAVLRGPHGGAEHFGFKDGISQPSVRGFTESTTFNHGRWENKDRPGSPIIAAGEFVLGYPGERGSYPRARRPEPPGWMRDGSFQVFLRLTQDVAGWFEQMERLGGALAEDVAAKAIGRRHDGTALAPGGGGRGANDFDFAEDPEGDHTPRFAHIRKVNPRDNRVFNDRTHRVLRRGIPFGPRFQRDKAGAGDQDAERGLLLNAFMASIEDQFEFVQRWAGSPRSVPAGAGGDAGEPAADGPDPLIGASSGPCVLRRQGEEPVQLDLRRFVRTTGAVYAFTPSLPALRRLAGGQPMREG